MTHRAYVIFQYDDAKLVVLNSKRHAERLCAERKRQDEDNLDDPVNAGKGWHVREVECV